MGRSGGTREGNQDGSADKRDRRLIKSGLDRDGHHTVLTRKRGVRKKNSAEHT